MATARSVISITDAKPPLFVGVDVGGTNIKIGMVDDEGQTVAYNKIITYEERGPADAVLRVADMIRDTIAEELQGTRDIVAIGLGTPGSMDIPRGMILFPPNLPHWKDFPIRDALAEACGLPVAFANDANAAAYGEFWVGSGRAHRSMIMLTLGTGVGGGIIVDGLSIDGVNSFGSECGHIIVDSRPDARECVWGGGAGQLEAYASASAVAARAAELLPQHPDSSLQPRVDSGEELTTLMLFQEAEAGDAFSLDVILEAAKYLGIGIVTLVHTIDPGAVILGGAMNFGRHDTQVGRAFLEAVRNEFRQRAFDVVAENTTIDYAILGGDAGYIGAAGIARKMHHDQRH